MEASGFKKRKLAERWNYLKSNEYYMASRSYGEFRIDLHYDGTLYMEVWKKFGLNQIYWIELVVEELALKNYIELPIN